MVLCIDNHEYRQIILSYINTLIASCILVYILFSNTSLKEVFPRVFDFLNIPKNCYKREKKRKRNAYLIEPWVTPVAAAGLSLQVAVKCAEVSSFHAQGEGVCGHVVHTF